MTTSNPAIEHVFSYEEEKSRLEEIDRQNDIAMTQSLMASPHGRRYLWNLMAFCSVFASSQSLDLGYLAYGEGRRNVGLRILHSIQAHAPEQYAAMVTESAAVTAHLRAVKVAEDAQQKEDFS